MEQSGMNNRSIGVLNIAHGDSAGCSMESPRKGRKWTLATNGSPVQQEKEQPNQSRGFRLLSPKKALELKKQAKARKQKEKKLYRENTDGGSGGMMPIWEKAPRGASPAKRTGIHIRSEVLHTIEDPSEDGSAASVGVDEIFGTEQTRGDLNRSSDGMQWASPSRTQSAPQQARTKPHAPRRSVSEEFDLMNAGNCSRNSKSGDLADICFVPPAEPTARICSDSAADRRKSPNTRVFHPPERQLSHGHGDQCGQPVLVPPSSPPPAHPPTKQRGQYTKPPRVDDFQQSLHFMELFEDDEEEIMESENAEYDPIHAQEEEMMAMAMEQSVREMTAPDSPRAVRTASKAAGYLEMEKSVLRKQDWLNDKYTYTVKAKKSVVRPSRNTGTADTEAIRIAEEEQEKEMIQLAMERSLAEAPMPKVLRSTTNKVHARGRRPQRYGQQNGRTTAGPAATADEDEIARREQEMIRRALEMSRNDF